MAIPQAWMMAVAGTVLVALALATGPAAGAYTPIFARGEDGVDCYRAPALVQTSNGTLVAFAEARSACHGDHKAPRSIVCRRSFDMGANWGAISPVAGSGVSGDVASSPTALYNPDLDLVFLQYTLDGANEQITSNDGGATWNQPIDLNPFLGEYANSSVGPGVGLLLSAAASPTPGRMLWPGYNAEHDLDLVWYSDDGGKTFAVAETTFGDMNQAQAVELNDGAVVINMRNDHASACECRAAAASGDGGETFESVAWDTALVSPVCQASILRIGDYVYFANPASKSSRVNLTLRRASAAGPPPIAWTGAASKSLYYGPSAYSCLATLNATHMAVAFENGILDPNDYISIVAVELEFSADQ